MSTYTIPQNVGKPNFDNLLAVLRREVPARPTLFEFFLNDRLYNRLTADEKIPDGPYSHQHKLVLAFRNAGYDYVTMMAPSFAFPSAREKHRQTISLNEGALIKDRATFETYPWPDPDAADYAMLDALAAVMPAGMKFIGHGPEGVLENTIKLVGYEHLCYLLADDADLVKKIFDAVGSRLLRYYEHLAAHPAIGACISNDDWGFKTQTLLSPRQMRRYVFPWHKRIVATLHAADKPAILHSCGHFTRIIDDVIDDMAFDARHSYEDNIMPVEEAYDQYHDRIAILGGLDVDFICRSTPDIIYKRAKAMLERAAEDGGYALGTGNSVPDYIPDEAYFAMTAAVLEER